MSNATETTQISEVAEFHKARAVDFPPQPVAPAEIQRVTNRLVRMVGSLPDDASRQRAFRAAGLIVGAWC